MENEKQQADEMEKGAEKNPRAQFTGGSKPRRRQGDRSLQGGGGQTQSGPRKPDVAPGAGDERSVIHLDDRSQSRPGS
jgi:hypothetical protein